MADTPEPQPPIPLPQLEWDRVDDPAARKAAEALTHWLVRERERTAQNTDSLSGGLAGVQGGLQGLLLRVKDIYTFGVPGTVSVTAEDAMGLSLPLRVVADSTLLEARADLFAGSGTVIDLLVDGDIVLTLTAGSGNQSGFFSTILAKDDVLSAFVTDKGTDAKGLVVQVRCG